MVGVQVPTSTRPPFNSFVALLGWVLSGWAAKEERAALAMDLTSLGQVLLVLVISVVYRGCAILIAWRVLPALEKGSWKELLPT